MATTTAGVRAGSAYAGTPRATGHVQGTTPYPWPWDAVLDATRTAVLLVESPGLPERASEQTRKAGVVVATLRRAGAPAVRILAQRPPRALPRVDGGPSREGAIDGIPTDDVVVSHGVDGFYGSVLEPLLRTARIERLLLVGGWLETSVHSTMRTANDMGFECLLVVDACIPADEALVANSVSMIEMSGGIFGAVGHAADVVEAYARAEGEPE